MSAHDRDWPVQQAWAASLAGRAITATVTRVEAAWRTAASVHFLRATAHHLGQATPAANLRTAALSVLSAALWHMIFRSELPAYATSALPNWVNVMIAGVAALIAWQATPIVSAWPRSTAGALWRRLTGA